jgi:hypothetical protein
MGFATWMWIILFALGLLLFLFYRRMARFLRCVFFTAFSGVGALGLLWLLGLAIPVPVTITPFSLAVSGILGIPGVVTMLILHLI